MRLGWVVLAAVWGAAVAQQPVTTLQAHARAVVVDVVVTDGKGHAVTGLKAADFDVLEDGAAQTIKSFEEIRPKVGADGLARVAAPPKLPPNTFTNANVVKEVGASTVLLVDYLDTSLQAQAYAHQQLESYLKSAAPTAPIAIFQLGPQLRLIQGFTTDIDRLRQAVKERDKVLSSPLPMNNGYVATRFRYDDLTRGMQELGKYLAQYPGRKNLIWFTGSVPNYTYDDGTAVGGALRDSETFTFDYAQTTDVLTLGRVSVYPVDANGLRTNPAFSAAQRGVPSIGEITSFSVNEGLKHQDLDRVAEATGGKAFYNTNGLKQAIAEVVETGAHYYTITYTPTNNKWDGSYRKLKVDLDVAGKLEYRRGYYAMRDAPPAPARSGGGAGTQAADALGRRQITHHETEDGFAASMQLGAIDPGSIVFEAHFKVEDEVQKVEKGLPPPDGTFLEGKYKGKAFRNYVVEYTVDGKQFQLTPDAAGLLSGKVEFVALVLDDKGGLVNSELMTVDMNMKPETYAYIRANGAALPLRIAVPVKGNYFLRAGVHDVPSGKGGALELAVSEVR